MKTKIKNLWKYGKMDIPTEVDPQIMQPIFEKYFKEANFYSKEDELIFNKEKLNSLSIWYTGNKLMLNMEIVSNPSEHDWWTFGKYVNSYLKVNQVMNSEDSPEVRKTLENICKKANIEKITLTNNMNLPKKERDAFNNFGTSPEKMKLLDNYEYQKWYGEQ